MANVINATSTGNGGLISTGDDSGILNIQTNETTAVSVDASQNLTFTNGINAPNTFGFKNRIINGGMTIDQRNAGASVTPVNQQYTLDRWLSIVGVASKFTVQQNAGSVTPPAGFINYLGATSTSAYSVAAGDVFGQETRIEGLNTADLAWGTANAKSITVSFWVYSSLTGNFGCVIRNNANTRSYPFLYSISSANTWEYKTVTIPGDTSGTWLTNNSSGVKLTVNLGCGSTYSGTPGAWASAEYYSATGATSVVGTNGATFYITGVQLEKGTQATSFDFRDYGSELAMCQRYYYKIFPGSTNKTLGMGFAGNSTTVYAYIAFQTTMRTSPGAMEQNGVASDYMIAYGGTSTNCNAVPGIINASQDGSNVIFSVASGLTTGDGVQARTSSGGGASAYLAWSAEL